MYLQLTSEDKIGNVTIFCLMYSSNGIDVLIFLAVYEVENLMFPP